jgi:hypothetical protein
MGKYPLYEIVAIVEMSEIPYSVIGRGRYQSLNVNNQTKTFTFFNVNCIQESYF